VFCFYNKYHHVSLINALFVRGSTRQYTTLAKILLICELIKEQIREERVLAFMFFVSLYNTY
jgi:hypothetical protein